MTKNKKSTQPKATVVVREIFSDRTLGGFSLRKVPITLLGQVRIGTIWENGICTEEVEFETAEFEVSFKRDDWRFTSFFSQHQKSEEFPYPPHIYPLMYHRDRNYSLEFPVSGGGNLLIPCLEFFSRCYGSSQEVKRILTTYPFRKVDDPYNRFFVSIGVPETEGCWQVAINNKYKFSDADARYLAWLKYSKYTQLWAKDIYAQMDEAVKGIADNRKERIVQLKIRPWHEQKSRIRVSGISFNSGRSFLALNVLGCSPPSSPQIKVFTQQNDPNSEAGWSGHMIPVPIGSGMRDNSPHKERLAITNDSDPDHSGPRKSVKDPEFVELAHPDSDVLPILSEKISSNSRSVHGVFSKGEAFADRYSSGDRYGSNKGVGEIELNAPLKLESNGVLLDIWNAFLYLRDSFPLKILKVEWFTFATGFCDRNPPELIEIKPFKKHEIVLGSVRSWPYLYPRNSALRGALVIKVTAKNKPIYVVEIQRRWVNDGSDDGEHKEESMSGLCFTIDSQGDFERFLNDVFSKIRHKRGVFKSLIDDCSGEADYFTHKHSVLDKVNYESAARNALRKMGLRL